MELNPAQQFMANRLPLIGVRAAGREPEAGDRRTSSSRASRRAFAGGMGRSGEVCGAVVGAIMCIGIKYGREESGQSRPNRNAHDAALRAGFPRRDGQLHCRELTGFDLSTPEGLQAFRASDVPMRVCLRAVGFAYDETLKLLEA